MATATAMIQPNQSLVAAKIESDTILLDVDSGVYFGLDEVGTRVWDLLAEGSTEDEITDRLEEEFEVDPDLLRSDVHEFLEQLLSSGLVLKTEI